MKLRIPAAGWCALVAVLLAALGLRALAGGTRTTPPLPAYPRMTSEVFRYTVSTGRAPSEILLFGSSLMHLGIQEDILAKDLGDPELLVMNLGLEAAGPWEELRLVESLPPSRATGRRLAIVEVNRVTTDASRGLPPYGAMRLRAVGRLTREPGLRGLGEALWEQVPPRQDLGTWTTALMDGVIGPRFPSLVRPPPAPPRLLWSVGEMERRRAVATAGPRAVAESMKHRQLSEATIGFAMTVAELKKRGFQVLVIQMPMHGEFLKALAEDPANEAVERAYRAAVLDPAATGADDALVFDHAADIGADDGVFADYAHLSQEASALLTHRIAEHLRSSPAWGRGRERIAR